VARAEALPTKTIPHSQATEFAERQADWIAAASAKIVERKEHALGELERALRQTPTVDSKSMRIAEEAGWRPDLEDNSFYSMQASWEHHRMLKREEATKQKEVDEARRLWPDGQKPFQPVLSERTKDLADKARRLLPEAEGVGIGDRLLLEGEQQRRRKQLRTATAWSLESVDPTPLITELARSIETNGSCVDRLYPYSEPAAATPRRQVDIHLPDDLLHLFMSCNFRRFYACQIPSTSTSSLGLAHYFPPVRLCSSRRMRKTALPKSWRLPTGRRPTGLSATSRSSKSPRRYGDRGRSELFRRRRRGRSSPWLTRRRSCRRRMPG
jgi:hypothetical protein